MKNKTRFTRNILVFIVMLCALQSSVFAQKNTQIENSYDDFLEEVTQENKSKKKSPVTPKNNDFLEEIKSPVETSTDKKVLNEEDWIIPTNEKKSSRKKNIVEKHNSVESIKHKLDIDFSSRSYAKLLLKWQSYKKVLAKLKIGEIQNALSAILNEALALGIQGDFDELQAFDIAIALALDAELLAEKGYPEISMQVFKIAKTLAPSYSSIYFKEAKTALVIGQYPLAIKGFFQTFSVLLTSRLNRASFLFLGFFSLL